MCAVRLPPFCASSSCNHISCHASTGCVCDLFLCDWCYTLPSSSFLTGVIPSSSSLTGVTHFRPLPFWLVLHTSVLFLSDWCYTLPSSSFLTGGYTLPSSSSVTGVTHLRPLPLWLVLHTSVLFLCDWCYSVLFRSDWCYTLPSSFSVTGVTHFRPLPLWLVLLRPVPLWLVFTHFRPLPLWLVLLRPLPMWLVLHTSVLFLCDWRYTLLSSSSVTDVTHFCPLPLWLMLHTSVLFLSDWCYTLPSSSSLTGVTHFRRKRCSCTIQFYNVMSSCNNNNNNNNNNNRIRKRYSRFFTISSERRELSPTRTLKWPGRNRVQITSNTSRAYHVQVSCYVPLGTKGQLSY